MIQLPSNPPAGTGTDLVGAGRASPAYLASADQLADAIDSLFAAPTPDTPGQPAAVPTGQQVVEQADLTGKLTRLSTGIAVHSRHRARPAWAELADALGLAAELCRDQIPPAEPAAAEPAPAEPSAGQPAPHR